MSDDVFVGLDDATPEAWTRWHDALLEQRRRATFDASLYDDDRTAWSDTQFRQLFLFMYDTAFFDGRYRTRELVEAWRAKFGRVDQVVLWHAYPRLGFDSRTQFDFYRQMPGGIAKLREEVCDVLHAHGIRVVVDFNPWDVGTHDELAAIVSDLDADAVMLDTMTAVPDELAAAVARRREGVVFMPELRMKVEDLGRARQSWAQWLDVGDGPSIHRNRWLAPRHRQFVIARWDTSRKRDIVYAFFNGAGLVLWENVFGAYNPCSREDRKLIAETSAIVDRYGDLFVRGEWLPLVPTGVSGLDANRFIDGSREIVTLRNRTSRALSFDVPRGPASAFWGAERELAPGDRVKVEPHGTQAVVFDDPDRARAALAHFDELSRRADVELADHEQARPRLRVARAASAVTTSRARMIDLSGGTFDMRIVHSRRECGCYPLGASGDAMWGSDYRDTITHEIRVEIAPFAIRETAVTNAEFLEFVRASGYRPKDQTRFLAGSREPELPVTHVSLDDARAYAAFYGERLPSEAEWQWAAEGAGLGLEFPWGEGARTFPPVLRRARDEATATPQGVVGLSGNAWELTESEHDDGHTRFVMLRGGSYLPPAQSEWIIERGPRPNAWHAKYILMSDGLDRSEAISFRTVR